uniref:Uncharacterized protein n=1 Tax=Anguilla anguilla TaxID=7936 RepID=A0A0E9Q1U8_ANGAN
MLNEGVSCEKLWILNVNTVLS